MKLFGSKPDTSRPDLVEHTDDHRFALAVILVAGFMILIGIAMMGGYKAPIDLAGIFSGWIVAIIGFYFLEQSSERSAKQQSNALSNVGQRSLDILLAAPEQKFEKLVQTTKEKIDELEREKNVYREIAERYRKVAEELVSEDEGVNE